jgi:hypothetical protein
MCPSGSGVRWLPWPSATVGGVETSQGGQSNQRAGHFRQLDSRLPWKTTLMTRWIVHQ